MAEREGPSVSILRRGVPVRPGAGLVPALLGTMLFAEFFLPRFVLHFGDRELSIDVIVTLVSVAILVLIGGIRPEPTRVALFFMAITGMLVAAAFNGGGVTGRVSAPSFLLLASMYIAYIFVVPDDTDETFQTTLRIFRRFALIVTVAGVCQFFAQIAIPGPMLFTFESFLPDTVLAKNFNYVIPVPGALELNKSNGFFLLEPSHFSQLVGLAIVTEMAFFRPSWRLAILALGLLLSYSGTGLVLCAVFVPLLLFHRGHGRLLLVMTVGGCILLMFADLIHLASTFDRVSEFGSEQSSAFARFLSPFYLFSDVVFPHAQTTLFGLGPGSIEPYFRAMDYLVHDPTWGKVFFEYGMVGTIPFVAFLWRCFFVGAKSYWLSATVFFAYLLLGGNLVDARMEPLILSLVVFQGTVLASVTAPAAYQMRSFEPRPP
jgi:hypothetical protein